MWLLYLVACIEGFSTLAVEIIALRLAAPVVGSSSITTSVFLGIILLALSAGYWYGGYLASHLNKNAIRLRIGWYLLFAACWYGAISFVFETALLQRFLGITGQYIVTLFTVSIVLFFLPVFTASQTVPLLTELIPNSSKGQAAGNMLFASTVGSFLGSVGTSIFLFQYLGVVGTGFFVYMLLFVCVLLWWWHTHRKLAWLSIGCMTVGVICYGVYKGSSSAVYSFDSAYQNIRIVDGYEQQGRPLRVFKTNDAFASAIYLDSKTSPFVYMQEAVTQTIALQPERVLVIGAAGFSYPYEVGAGLAAQVHIDVVDVDPHVKEIAERYFLEDVLAEYIHFIPFSARFVLHNMRNEGETYDVVFIDAFHGKAIPPELTTQEFFEDIHKISGDGVVIINAILDKELSSDLAQKTLGTLQSVFGEIWFTFASTDRTSPIQNVILSTTQLDETYILASAGGTIYTDNKYTTERDTIKLYQNQ